MRSDKVKISFRNNAPGHFGFVLRSSAIFYVRSGQGITTTISFMDYWRVKRKLAVGVVASIREMDGTLIKREILNFDQGLVINYVPVEKNIPFEGSCEIEIWCAEDMVIPYAAIMAAYETPRGISIVHAYARTYSRHETEEGLTIHPGHEGCWTVRDTQTVRSIGVLHNGGGFQAEQSGQLEIINHKGLKRSVDVSIPAMSPFATFTIRPANHIEDIVDFLQNKPGYAALTYDVADCFPRMLVGNEAVDGNDVQFTHSNFDYRKHETDYVDDDAITYMCSPDCGYEGKSVVVYPHSAQGRYKWSGKNGSGEFSSGYPVLLDTGKTTTMLEFCRKDGPMPTRLVTGLIVPGRKKDTIVNDCSLGVLTQLQPEKHFWWGICVADKDGLTGRLIVHDMPDLYGGLPKNAEISICLYSQITRDPLTAKLDGMRLESLEEGLDIRDIFPTSAEHLGGQFGYFTLYCAYGGLTCYSALENSSGSISIERAF